MINNNIQGQINESLNFGDLSKKVRQVTISARYGNNYSEFDYYKKEYTNQEIKNFYKENSKILFKKGNKFQEELYNTWSKSKYENLVNVLISAMLSKGISLDEVVIKLGNIIKKVENNNINNTDLSDEKIIDELKKGFTFDYEGISKELSEKGFKNFVYKYVIPNAVLNDGKGQFYTSNELNYIADLRYNHNELKKHLEQFKNFGLTDFSDVTINEIRKKIKRQIELMIILFFINESLFNENDIKGIINQMDEILKIENPSINGLYLNSYSSILYSMIDGKNDYSIDYQGLLSPFIYIDNIKELLELLGEVSGIKL